MRHDHTRRAIGIATVLATALVFSVPAAAEVPEKGVFDRYSHPHVPGRILVKYRQDADAVLRMVERRAVDADVIRSHLGGRIELLRLHGAPSGEDLRTAIRRLQASKLVEWAQPDYIRREMLTPDDTNYSQQWSMKNDGSNVSNGSIGADMNMETAWDVRTDAVFPGGGPVVVAIIDDAVDTDHPDLEANIVDGGACFGDTCDGDSVEPDPDAQEDQSHGTFVAGMAGAVGNNSSQLAGAAWRVGILPIKQDFSDSALLSAIDHAIAEGADIINMSLGGPIGSDAEEDALAAARDAGILITTSAGNSDSNNDRSQAHFPSNYPLDNILSMASSEGRDRISRWSQWGPFTVDLAAPGELVPALEPGGGTLLFSDRISGTSFSTPYVAGVAALVKAELVAQGTIGENATAAWRAVRAHLLHGGQPGEAIESSSEQPGERKEAVPGRTSAGRLDGGRALIAARDGLDHGVLVPRGVTIVDPEATGGDADGVWDPGETVTLEVELENAWVEETGVEATLSTSGLPEEQDVTDSLVTINDGTATIGTFPQHSKQSVSFDLTLSADAAERNEQLFFILSFSSDSGGLADRHLYHEIGTLESGVEVSHPIQRWNWDEYHTWTIDVPADARELVLETHTEDEIDIDLLARAGADPEYLIALNPPEGQEFFFVGDGDTEDDESDDTYVSGLFNGDERLVFRSDADAACEENPLVQGTTYFLTVVNFAQVSHDYRVEATVDPDGIRFTCVSPEVQESVGSVELTVRRTGDVSGSASVDFRTRGGTADSSDFDPTSGTLEWDAGDDADKTISVSVIDDSTDEGDNDRSDAETFRVILENVQGSVLSSPSEVSISIIDDDSPSTGGGGGGTGGGGGGTSGGGGGGGAAALYLLAIMALIGLARRRTGFRPART